MLAVISFIRPNSSCAALRYRLGRASPRKHSSNKNRALPKAWIGFLSSWATEAIKRPLAAKSSVRPVLPDCRRADEVRVNTPTSSRCGLTQKDCLSGERKLHRPGLQANAWVALGFKILACALRGAYSRRADLGQEI